MLQELITIEVKSDKNKTLLFQAHARGAETSNFIYKTIGTEWQTIKIETGCWNTDWEGILQIAGDLRGKTYFKNMKMEQRIKAFCKCENILPDKKENILLSHHFYNFCLKKRKGLDKPRFL